MQDRAWLAVAGTAAGLGFFTRYDAALYLTLLILFPVILRWTRGQRSGIVGDVAVYSLALAPWVAGVAAWDYARFGSPFLTGLHEATFGESPWLGLLGLTVSPGKGLVWYLPLLLLLPWAFVSFYRRVPELSLFLVSLVIATVLFYSSVLYWHGDPAWGPRYLYVVVPYLILPLGEIFMAWRARSSTLRAAVLGAIAVSLVLQLGAVSVTQWRFWYRLQLAEQNTTQPFRWGAKYYHYYWNAQESPILLQLDDVYQVVRLSLGAERYRLTAKPPDPYVHSNPAVDYPVNSLAFWWADTRHPLLGERARAAIALGLTSSAIVAFALLMALLRRTARGELERRRHEEASAERAAARPPREPGVREDLGTVPFVTPQPGNPELGRSSEKTIRR